MICYKCGNEMITICDSAWRNHNDGTRARATEFMCVECRVWIEVKALDFAEVDLDGDEE